MTRRSALVTGGAGFIGSTLVDDLLKEGWRVVVVDSFDPYYDPEIKRQYVSAQREHPDYTLVETDIRDAEELRRRLSGEFDVIVHLAAKVGVRPSLSAPGAYVDVNVGGTRTLLELAAEWGVRQFVFASSSSVYGLSPRLPWREDDPDIRPISPYAATKLVGEGLGRAASERGRLRFVALRFFTVYGPRQRPDLAIHRFARRMLDGLPVPVYGDGSSRRDYTYVGDVVAGVKAAMRYTATDYEVINLGNDCTVSVNEMIDVLEDAVGIRATRRFLDERPGDLPQTWANLTKAGLLLGYRPSTSFPEGIEPFIAWLGTRTARPIFMPPDRLIKPASLVTRHRGSLAATT
jgi:UDP-glucuronate 4-epimerase